METTTYKKITERLEKRREGVHKFMAKNILPLGIAELSSWVIENQRNNKPSSKAEYKNENYFCD